MNKTVKVFVKMLIHMLPAKIQYRVNAWKMWVVGEQESRILPRLMPKGSTAIDIGANRGAYTYWLSKLCGTVISMEPIPYLAQYLNYVTPKNVSIIEVALSDVAGSRDLKIPVLDGQVVDGESSLENDFKDYRTCTVKLSRLDDFDFARIDFVKIDVEGHELNVIKGGARTITTHMPVLLIEIEQRHISIPISQILEFILSLGYKGFFISNRKLMYLTRFNLQKHQSIESNSPYINNFIFLPRKRKDHT